jgi:hypothetical protein
MKTLSKGTALLQELGPVLILIDLDGSLVKDNVVSTMP